ncbi:hypothetical protein K310107B6_21500 [Mediterraneibacter gnavus]
MKKHTRDDTVHRVKKTVEQRPVIEKEVPEIFINGKNAMSMIHIHEFKRHTGSAFHGIFIATGRKKTTVATERDKFPIFTMCADIHGATIGRIATVNYFFDVFHYNRSWF